MLIWNQINKRLSEIRDIIRTSEKHQSVERIKVGNSNETKTFDFSHVTEEKIKNEILHLSADKSTRHGDIRAKVLINCINMYSKKLTSVTKCCLEKGLFPDELKKKDKYLNKENYRPVSILSELPISILSLQSNR